MTAGVGKRFNNPCNVRCLDVETSLFEHVMTCEDSGPSGWFAHFNDPRDGIAACVELYARKYRGLATKSLVGKWAATNEERNPEYFDAVESCFNS